MATEVIGKITQIINGPIEIATADGQVRTVNQGDPVYLQDTVITPARSYVKIILNDGSEIQVGPLSRLSLDKYSFSEQAPQEGGELETSTFAGIFRFISGKLGGDEEKPHTTIKTPSANIGIRGSELDVQVDEHNATTIIFSSGLIDVTTQAGTVSVYEPGTQVFVATATSYPETQVISAEDVTKIRELLTPLNLNTFYPLALDENMLKSLQVETETSLEKTSVSDDLGALNPFSTWFPQNISLSVHEFIPDLRFEPLEFAQTAIEHITTTTTLLSIIETLAPALDIDKSTVPVEKTPPYPKNPVIFNEDNAVILRDIVVPEASQRDTEILSPQQGTVINNQDGSFTYVPFKVDYQGTDSFGFRFNPTEEFTLVAVPPVEPLTIRVMPAESTESLRIAETATLLEELTQPAHGQVIDNGDGTLTYLPEPNFYGEDSFTYRLAGEQSLRVELVVQTINDAPQINADLEPDLARTTAEDTPLVIPASTLLANDLDVEGGAVSLFAANPIQGSAQGAVHFDSAQNAVIFSPAANFSGQTTFLYTITDDKGVRATSQAGVTVSPVNDAPLAGADTLTLSNNFNLSVAATTLLANDSDVEGDPLRITAVQNAQDGTVSFNPQTGTILFSAKSGTLGGRFDYVVSDGQTDSLGHVTVRGQTVQTFPAGGVMDNVFPPPPLPNIPPLPDDSTVPEVNKPPIAQDDGPFPLGPYSRITLTPAQLLANDSDPENDTLSIIRLSDVLGGITDGTFEDEDVNDETAFTSITFITGRFDFDPQSGVTFTELPIFFGRPQFDYWVSDGKGGLAQATVTLEGIIPTETNQLPIANADSLEITKTEPTTFGADQLLANDSDPDNDFIRVVEVGPAVGGTIELKDDTLIFTPDSSLNESAQFTYIISDGKSGIATAPVTLKVNPNEINHTPQLDEDALTIPAGKSTSIPFTQLLANDHDEDGDALTVSAVTDAIHGRVELTADQVTFTPTADFNEKGTGAFTYEVSDGQGGIATAQVNLQRTNENPLANADQMTVSGQRPTTFAVATVLANDRDADNDTLTVSKIENAVNGRVEWDEQTGQITFTPAADFKREGQFSYSIEDGHGGTADTLVTLQRENTNPVAQADTLKVSPTQPATIPAVQLLVNDSDSDQDPLTVVEIGTPLRGTLTLNDGNLLFTPTNDFAKVGTDQFTYTVTDGNGGTTTAEVTLLRTNENPVTSTDSLTIPQAQSATILSTLLLANDRDADGDTLTLSLVGEAVHGQVKLDAAGDVVFIPEADFDSVGGQFTYTVVDGQGGTATGTVTLSPSKSNHPPEAEADFFTTVANAALPIASVDLLANDRDADNEKLTIAAVEKATQGQVELTAQGDVLYTPAPDFVGLDQFVYAVADPSGTTAQATVTVAVTDVGNKPPLATDDELSKPFQVPLTFPTADLLANDGDLNLDDSLTVSAVNSTDKGVELALINNEVRLFIDALRTENYDAIHFDYTVSDSQGGTAQATVTVQSSNVIHATPNETVNGTENLDIIVGSEHGDTFAANQGPDLLLGRSGNDTFLLNPTAAAGMTLIGGKGKDTLRLDGEGQVLDLTNNSSLADGQKLSLQGLEIIDLNGTNQLRLSIQDVLDLTEENRLIVEGTGQSFVKSTDQGWSDQGLITVNDTLYHNYLGGEAQLLINTEIEARFIS